VIRKNRDMLHYLLLAIATIAALIAPLFAHAEQADPGGQLNTNGIAEQAERTIRADRWLEDWGWLSQFEGKQSSNDRVFLKSIHMSDDLSLDLGFDAHLRYEAKSPLNFGTTPEGYQAVAAGRVLGHGNLTIGSRARVYLELGVWGQSGRVRPNFFDKANLALQRGFLDYAVSEKLKLRIGRQDLYDRSSRLLRAADALNYQQVFDAIAIDYSAGVSKTEFYLAKPFLPRDGYFQRFKMFGRAAWAGFSHRQKSQAVNGLSYGVYGVWQDRDRAAYISAAGSEQRGTLISRISYRDQLYRASVEYGRQFGHVGDQRIAAWAFAFSLSTALNKVGDWRVGVRIDGASGDQPTTDTHESWAPVFPGMFYLGRHGIYNPTNAIGIYPEITYAASPKWRITLSSEHVWRVSNESAFAAPGGAPLVPALALGRDQMLSGGALDLRWKPSPRYELRLKTFMLDPRGAFEIAGGERLQGVTINLIARY
jgi:hypothetical protein